MQARCYSYIRFSSREQRKGDSFRRQTAYATEYAKTHGLLLDDTLRISDLGLSAFHGHHRTKGALGIFLEEIKNGKIPKGSHLVIEALDRLTRQETLEAVHLFTGILLEDIIVCTAADNMIYDRDHYEIGELVISAVKLAQGHEESFKKQQRALKTWEGKRANLLQKKLTKKAPSWLKLSQDRKTFHVIPERAEIVKQIFEMKLNGVGSDKISKLLNQSEGWKPQSPRDRKPIGWRKSYIDKILRNKSTIGEFQPHTTIEGVRQHAGEPVKDYFPRILSDELFFAVQEQIAINIGKGGKNGKICNLFGAIAKCGYCESPMQYINKGQAHGVGKYLVCDKARRALGCVSHSVRYESFEELVLRYCKGLDPTKILPDTSNTKSEIIVLQNTLTGIRGSLADKGKKIKNIVSAIEDCSDKNARKTLNNRLKELEQQIAQEKNDEKQLNNKIGKLSSSHSDAEKQIKDLKEFIIRLPDAPPEVRQSLRNKLRSLIKGINIYAVGRPLMTPERVESLLQAMLSVMPETTPDELEKERVRLSAKIGNKELAYCDIFFRSGSIRSLNLGRYPEMPMEIDREEDIAINQIITQDGVEKTLMFSAN